MKRTILLTMLFLLYGINSLSNAAHPLIELNGKKYWMNGINMPWNAFGTDIGTHYQWGALHDSALFDQTFKNSADNKINCVRIWIHCDGRSTPEFDAPGGSATGLDANFFKDFDNMMALAQKYKIFVMPALWSFDMVKVNTGAGQYGGVQTPLIKDSLKTISYINNALVPIVKRYANHPYLFAWEICNEPEWIVETEHACTIKELQRFHAMLAAAIHNNCTNYVTTGAASLKWNSNHQDCTGGGGGHWWSDSALKATYSNNSKAFLDIYQVHFYEWMVPWYVPYTKGVDYWKDIGDRPVIIGETPGNDVNSGQFVMTLSKMYDTAYALGYAGVFGWSDRANDGHGIFDNIKIATSTFYSKHADIVDGVPTKIKNQHTSNRPRNSYDFLIIAKEGSLRIKLNDRVLEADNITVSVYDLKGCRLQSRKLLSGMKSGKDILDISTTCRADAIYFIQIKADDFSVTKRFELVR